MSLLQDPVLADDMLEFGNDHLFRFCVFSQLRILE